MEKTITVGGQKLRLSNNVGWTLAYYEQFGRDIIPAFMPVLWSFSELAGSLIGKLDTKGGKVDTAELLRSLSGSDELMEALVKLSGLEFVDFVNITWAMAKAADDSIENPREWVRQFDEFPLDVIGPEVIGLAVKGFVSSKNLKRLRALVGKGEEPEPTTTASE